MSTLEIKNLNVSFGEKQLVQDINLTLRMDKITGLIGQSGSGKSLTSLAILGFLPPNLRGKCEIWLDRERINFRKGFFANVMQNPRTAFNPLNSMKSHAKETIKARNLREKFYTQNGANLKDKFDRNSNINDEIKSAFKSAGLSEDVLELYPPQMSGGMLQRAMIALTLLARPKFIIADEPTTDLDLLSQKKVLDMLSDLAIKSGVGMLIITHDFGVIRHICDEVFVMENGRLIEHGSVADVFENPQSDGAKQIIGAYKFLNKSAEICDENVANLASNLDENAPDLKQNLALNVHDLNFSYKIFSLFKNSQKPVLSGVNFALESGKALGVLGVSGSGKSTLAQILMQIYAPHSAQITFFGKKLCAKNLASRREIYRQMQIVFQDPLSSVNPRNSVFECIKEPLDYLFKFDKTQLENRVKEVLSFVGLSEDFLSKLALNLSGGQIQRVLIARALAVRPKVLILDESLSSLDTILQVKFIELLKRLKSQLTLIFITHDIRLARILCDEIVLLDGGKIAEIIKPNSKMKSQIGRNLENSILK
jgi:5-methyltetrahydropteroyltriglutamate--homocysteine S-methyltransferase